MKRPYRLNCLPAIYSVSGFRRFYTQMVQMNCNEFCYCSLAPFAKAHLRCFPLLCSSFCSLNGAPFVPFWVQLFVQARNLNSEGYEWTVTENPGFWETKNCPPPKGQKIINTTKGTLLGHFVVTNDEKGSWTFHGPAVFFFWNRLSRRAFYTKMVSKW